MLGPHFAWRGLGPIVNLGPTHLFGVTSNLQTFAPLKSFIEYSQFPLRTELQQKMSSTKDLKKRVHFKSPSHVQNNFPKKFQKFSKDT